MNRAQFATMFEALSRTKTKYAECVKLTRTDGTVYRFTSHDNDIKLADPGTVTPIQTYISADAFSISAIDTSLGLSVSNMDLDAIITDDSISEDDLRYGKFDAAKVELFLSYWTNANIKILPLRTSWIGELQLDGEKFRADLRGLASKLAAVFIQKTSLECRYAFGDAKCTLSLAPYTSDFTITEVGSDDTFKCAAIPPGDYGNAYQWGSCLFLDGPLVGLQLEILRQFEIQVQLFLPPPVDFLVGNNVRLIKGCNKSYDACVGYTNLVNFGGEPFIKGADALTSTYPNFAER